MFINIATNRSVLFIRQLSGPVIPTFPGIPVQPTPPTLPYPDDGIVLIDTLPGFNEGLGVDFATQYISSISYNVPPEQIKAFDFQGTIDASLGLENLNLSRLSESEKESLNKINDALNNLTMIDGQGYILPDGTSFVVNLINIDQFNEADITNVLEKINAEPKKLRNDKISSLDIKTFFNDLSDND